MIVGDEILKRGFIKAGKASRLKNGTFDLTIGEIFAVGVGAANQRGRSNDVQQSYTIDPQEMVWVISDEEFKMPHDVTGLATLRTRLTHQGLLALNVGIIDSHFEGKISTAIINFSNIARTIEIGMPFFRVMFFEHDKLNAPEKADIASTRSDVNRKAAGEFPRNFLNIPELNEDYYGKQFGKMLSGWCKQHWMICAFAILIIALNLLSLRQEIVTVLEWLGYLPVDSSRLTSPQP